MKDGSHLVSLDFVDLQAVITIRKKEKRILGLLDSFTLLQLLFKAEPKSRKLMQSS